MKLGLEVFNRQHKEFMLTIRRWWLTRQAHYLNDAALSDFGFMALANNKPVCAMFFYPTLGSELAYCGWPIADLATTKQTRTAALKLVLEAMENLSKELGYKALVSYPSTEAMKTRMQQFGYQLGDKQCDNYIKVLR